MTQSEFLSSRREQWAETERVLGLKRREFGKAASGFPEQVRRLSQDLNTARSENYDPAIVERLNQLLVRAHQKLHVRRRDGMQRHVSFVVRRFPQAIRDHRRILLVFCCVFYGLGALTAVAVERVPERFALWFDQGRATDLETMYDPSSSSFLVPRSVNGDADMFGFYVYNNVSIAFRTFAGGMLVGVGSLLLLLYNAVFLGAATGLLVSRGFGEPFFTFVSGHAAIELSAIIIAAAAGFRLGVSVVFPGLRQTRLQSLRATTKEVLPLIYGATGMLLIAAVIEAFWSTSRRDSIVSYAVGIALLILMLVYFLFSGRRR